MSKYARTSPYHPIQIPLGFVLWSFWFVAMYGGHAVACEINPPDPTLGPWNWLNGTLGLLTLVTLAILVLQARRFWKLSRMTDELNERQIFVTKITSGLHLIAALATLYVGIPLLQLPPCI
ncbi:hypothetical protein DN824_11710 [Stutzerimonas nosocomialis]|uniref:Uncharacterized protein n=1 Tax=Stutzerimonas nosocomialis TaxID=1056496 RepID=A0A5R9QHF7_9GAMM|nr:hypothetical protein [Stutzerimonas nosocomialis]TLX57217.1 hypothetical protein DN824_11710 [Stutzerimonas nosocomialis]TLX59268.1 hypothetical protein DN826_00270 [Stutzerimonas nosocomialis]TLX64666.1 hypothetical protein DN820_04380 [Stutzerimonas nosocomialis]